MKRKPKLFLVPHMTACTTDGRNHGDCEAAARESERAEELKDRHEDARVDAALDRWRDA